MNWEFRLIKPESTTKRFLREAWEKSMLSLGDWMEKELVNAMINGGMGIQGIRQTEFYRFISSPEGLSQLGIPGTEPPKLLEAYKTSFKTKATVRTVRFTFGNKRELKLATPHPAAGTGKLKIRSWLDWVIGGKVVSDAGFVPRSQVPVSMRGNIRLRTPLGGLMLGAGAFGTSSSGKWEFPKTLQDFDTKWFRDNVSSIEAAITNKLIDIFGKKINE